MNQADAYRNLANRQSFYIDKNTIGSLCITVRAATFKKFGKRLHEIQ